MTDNERDTPGVVAPPPLIYLGPLVLGLLLNGRFPVPFLPRGLARVLGCPLLGGGVDESDHPTWDEVCDRAEVVSHRSYLDKLSQLGLLLEDPDKKVSANPAVSLEDFTSEDDVREMSNSLWF